MKPRQFKRLADVAKTTRAELVVEGLKAVGANVASLASELQACSELKAYRAAELTYNAAREEAGKFLVLIDVYRAPGITGSLRSRQFSRAGNHLSKLIYAQMADYSIASQKELLEALRTHRQGLYLDGPNDYDYILRNELLWERESAMYVDLVDAEGRLEWWTPRNVQMAIGATHSILLIQAMLDTDLVSEAGLHRLQDAWRGFDPQVDSHCSEWTKRTIDALASLPGSIKNGELTDAASLVAHHWPMPMVELEVEEKKVTIEELQVTREQAHDAWMRSEFGDVY